MNVLVACEESQAVTIELRKLGHEAYSCDIIECSGGHPEWHIKEDVLPLLNGNCNFKTCDGIIHKIENKWDMLIAFPPCTHLCNSGQRWFTEGKKPMKLQREAISFFYKFVMADCEKIAIENPIGIMSSCYRKPNQVINPYEFGETECKNTCLWLKGLPNLKPTKIIPKERRTQNIWKANFNGKQYSWNDKEVAKLRSKTFPGIAKAMAEQWTKGGTSMWDITFCSKKECKNLKCERNQNNYNFMMAGNRPISIGEFKKCEYWEEKENARNKN